MAKGRDDQYRGYGNPNARSDTRNEPGRSGNMGVGGVGGGDSQHFDAGQRSGAHARSEDRHGVDRYGGSSGAGQPGGGSYDDRQSGMGGGQGSSRYGAESGGSTGGQPNQGYYGAGRMGDRNYGSNRPDQSDFGRGGMLSHRQGHPQSWGEAQEDPHPHRDEHHQGWGEQQRQQLDRDYDEFRQYRQERFNAEFDEWRRNRSGQGSNVQTGPGTQGQETERDAPGISTDKRSDDSKE